MASAGITSAGPCGPQYQRAAVEQRDDLPRHRRQQRCFRVDSLRRDAGGTQFRQPGVDARARHDQHRHAAGLRRTFADGEMQVLDLVGDALFEREGNHLRELGGAPGGRVAVGQQHVRRRYDHRDAASHGERCGLHELA